MQNMFAVFWLMSITSDIVFIDATIGYFTPKYDLERKSWKPAVCHWDVEDR